jgi:hypothetical protein
MASANRHERQLRSFTTYLNEPNVLASYRPTLGSSPLHNPKTTRIFVHFIHSAVRPAIPGLTYLQGCPPCTITFASTQPPYGAGSVHVTAFGAPFVTHGPPDLAYAQPLAMSSDNNPVGSVASAGMAQPHAYQFPVHSWQYPRATSVGGFPTTGMSNAQQYPPSITTPLSKSWG